VISYTVYLSAEGTVITKVSGYLPHPLKECPNDTLATRSNNSSIKGIQLRAPLFGKF
jgi:hypothetical protein